MQGLLGGSSISSAHMRRAMAAAAPPLLCLCLVASVACHAGDKMEWQGGAANPDKQDTDPFTSAAAAGTDTRMMKVKLPKAIQEDEEQGIFRREEEQVTPGWTGRRPPPRGACAY